MILCITEKPSVARDIAKVLKVDDEKKKGYLEGNGYIITWAVGHLIGLAEPEEYGFVAQDDMYKDEKEREKAYNELPIIPEQFKLVVLKKSQEQFEIVNELMHREDIEYIIDCGDMGPEGHILQWLIREKAGCSKKIKRFCATSMTDEAIKKAMMNLRDIEEFEPIIRGEFCKKKEDWLLGMNLSRALSIKYHAGINVGRVQSPTLAFIVKRYLEVINFKVTNYYTLEVDLKEGFKVFWSKDSEKLFQSNIKSDDDKILDKSVLQKKSYFLKGLGKGKIVDLSKTKRATDRPQLYDITELQRDANKRYGYSAAVTLSTAQALYETQKLLSYPRTDSRYITADLVPYVKQYIEYISHIDKYSKVAAHVLNGDLNFDKKLVDDSKVTDHHALIVTENIKHIDYSKIIPTEDEKKKGVTVESLLNVLDLVISRMLISLSNAFKYEQTNIVVQIDNMKFTASGKKPVQAGWKEVNRLLLGANLDENNDSEEQVFPDINKDDIVNIDDCIVVSKKTTPPKLHTEATLLTAMENAGQQIENGEILKGRGIGTQATRAEIIKKLFDTKVVVTEKKGKTPYIKPTRKGINIIRILPPDLYSPKITADWETRIVDIVNGKIDENKVMSDFLDYLKEKTEQVKNITANVSFAEREVYGVCPWCESDIYKYKSKDNKEDIRYYCSEACGWSLKLNDKVFLTRIKRNLTESEAKKFIAKKKIRLTCISQKSESKYESDFTFIENTFQGKKYCNINCEMVLNKSKSRKKK